MKFLRTNLASVSSFSTVRLFRVEMTLGSAISRDRKAWLRVSVERSLIIGSHPGNRAISRGGLTILPNSRQCSCGDFADDVGLRRSPSAVVHGLEADSAALISGVPRTPARR